MSWQQLTISAIFFATLLGLVKFQKFPERVFAAACLGCFGLSLISSDDLLGNAVNPGLMTLLLLVVCSFAFERTGFLRKLASVIFNGSVGKSYFRVLLTSSFASALLNNTAVVATMLAPIQKNKIINPGKLLLPVSYAAILGGTLTLIGTSQILLLIQCCLKKACLDFHFLTLLWLV